MRNTEKSDPAKMNEKKVKNTKKTKAKGNPNRSKQKVESSDPARWDWGKIMWFRAKKGDYKTKKYNPDRRPKRPVYDDAPEVRSESRADGEGNSPLARPLIPYDTRIDDKGPIRIKKNSPQKPSGKNAGPQVRTPSIGLISPEETLNKKKKNKVDREVDGKRLFTSRPAEERKAFDFDKLETAVKKDDPKKMENDRLMTSRVKDKPKDFNNDKLLYVKKVDPKKQELHGDRLLVSKPKDPKEQELHDNRLLVSKSKEPKKQDLTDDRILIKKPKIDRSKLHDERLLTAEQKEYSKKTGEDVAEYQGDYVVSAKKGKDYHPSSRHLAAERHGLPWLRKTQQGLSMFWSKIWPWDLQPKYVTEKKPKIRRDKKEGQIWDNSVHPDTWNQKPEQAESGED